MNWIIKALKVKLNGRYGNLINFFFVIKSHLSFFIKIKNLCTQDFQLNNLPSSNHTTKPHLKWKGAKIILDNKKCLWNRGGLGKNCCVESETMPAQPVNTHMLFNGLNSNPNWIPILLNIPLISFKFHPIFTLEPGSSCLVFFL